MIINPFNKYLIKLPHNEYSRFNLKLEHNYNYYTTFNKKKVPTKFGSLII
jgi:hypothetical protein